MNTKDEVIRVKELLEDMQLYVLPNKDGLNKEHILSIVFQLKEANTHMKELLDKDEALFNDILPLLGCDRKVEAFMAGEKIIHDPNCKRCRIKSRLVESSTENNAVDKEEYYNLQLWHERLISATMFAVGKIKDSYGSDALDCFQHSYNRAIDSLREQDENKVFEMRKGLPTLTGKDYEKPKSPPR